MACGRESRNARTWKLVLKKSEVQLWGGGVPERSWRKGHSSLGEQCVKEEMALGVGQGDLQGWSLFDHGNTLDSRQNPP